MIKKIIDFLKKDYVVTEDGFVVERHLTEVRFQYPNDKVGLDSKKYKMVYFKLNEAPKCSILLHGGAKGVNLFDVNKETGIPLGFVREADFQKQNETIHSLMQEIKVLTEEIQTLKTPKTKRKTR